MRIFGTYKRIVRNMTGMRKRVTIGFLSIVCLLFISGMLSFVELSRLSRATDDILKASRRNIELAKEMLDAAHELNVALIRRTVFAETKADSLCRASLGRLENVLSVAQAEALDKSFLDSLAFTTTEMKILVDGYLASHERDVRPQPDVLPDAADSLALNSLLQPVAPPADRWYTEEFEGVYNRLSAAVKAYMTSTQSSLAPRTEQMKKNAYRAVTPVLISLSVMIAIVLMLFYFMSIYCVNPIVQMNKGLGDWLTFRVPFAVKGDLKDEVLELREKIDALIALLKQNKA